MAVLWGERHISFYITQTIILLGVSMTKITTDTYRKFIRDNKEYFSEDGLIQIRNMRQLIADNFGSNYLTLRSHLRNLLEFDLINQTGSNFFALNKEEFYDLIKPQAEQTKTK